MTGAAQTRFEQLQVQLQHLQTAVHSLPASSLSTMAPDQFPNEPAARHIATAKQPSCNGSSPVLLVMRQAEIFLDQARALLQRLQGAPTWSSQQQQQQQQWEKSSRLSTAQPFMAQAHVVAGSAQGDDRSTSASLIGAAVSCETQQVEQLWPPENVQQMPQPTWQHGLNLPQHTFPLHWAHASPSSSLHLLAPPLGSQQQPRMQWGKECFEGTGYTRQGKRSMPPEHCSIATQQQQQQSGSYVQAARRAKVPDVLLTAQCLRLLWHLLGFDSPAFGCPMCPAGARSTRDCRARAAAQAE